MGKTGRSISFEELEEYSGDKVLAISIPFTALTTAFLGLRFWCKKLMRSRSGWDDLLLVVAYLVNVGLCAVVIVMTNIAGVGHHEEWVTNTNPSQIVCWAQLLLVFEFLHFAGITLPKLAILFFYIRVFSWNGRMRMACYTTMGVLVATWLASNIAACLQCRPLAFWWDKTIQGGTCFDVELFFRAQAITSPVLDAVILVLPMRSIWCLKLPESKKIELLFVFGVAGFGIIASIVRVQIFFTTAAFEDRTWASVDLCGWSIVEVGTYIITACLPEMRPMVSFLIPTRLLARARKFMTNPSTAASNPTVKARQYDNFPEFPSVVTRNSITQGQFKDCEPWDRACQDAGTQEHRSEQKEAGEPHTESYREEITERIDWQREGGLSMLVTRTTSVTITTLGSFDRPWECLGPSVASPTIESG